MPKFVYQPEGAKPIEWEWAPLKMASPDAELIEEATGMLFGKWIDAVLAGSMKARRAFVWVMLRKDQPGLRFDQVEIAFAETAWRLSDDELIERIKGIRRLPDEQRTESDEIVLQAYSGQLSDEQLGKIDAELKAEQEPEAGEDDPDPTPPASEPESAPPQPVKAKKKP